MCSTGKARVCENCGHGYSDGTVHACHPGYTSKTAQPVTQTWTISVPSAHQSDQPVSWRILDVSLEEYEGILEKRRQNSLEKRVSLLSRTIIDIALSNDMSFDSSEIVAKFPEVGAKAASKSLAIVKAKATSMKEAAFFEAMDLLNLGDPE
jgi:hypothetical protein